MSFTGKEITYLHSQCLGRLATTDPLAGLVLGYYGLKEGWAAWHNEA